MYVRLSAHDRHQGEGGQTQTAQKPAQWTKLHTSRGIQFIFSLCITFDLISFKLIIVVFAFFIWNFLNDFGTKVCVAFNMSNFRSHCIWWKSKQNEMFEPLILFTNIESYQIKRIQWIQTIKVFFSTYYFYFIWTFSSVKSSHSQTS